jgi:hypothetical protein
MAQVTASARAAAARLNIQPGEWLYLRLFKERGFSPRELREQWTLYELLSAHEVLDLELYTQQLAHQMSQRTR